MKIVTTSKIIVLCGAIVIASLCASRAGGHDHTLEAFLKARRVARGRAAARVEAPAALYSQHGSCQLTIELFDSTTKEPLPGLVRVTAIEEGTSVGLAELIHRRLDWYAMPARATVTVPQTKLKLEALHGLDTETLEHDVDLTGLEKADVKLPLQRFYSAAAKGLRSGNTHLHLMGLTHAEADRYLQVVPKADGLDLLYVSYLRRLPDELPAEQNYISNRFTTEDLKRLSQDGVLFGNGEEHRHNFGRGGEGYGHVMFLDIRKLIRPVSIGPGIMRTGTDGIPLQRGIQAARGDGAAVIWCHNDLGFEDVPNWMAGLLDAQNIFDGGHHGSYTDTFYRYLNLGMHVPFSTGTDWFIYDFSRVYVPIQGELSSKVWLRTLAEGRSFITNGTFLEFHVGTSRVGDTIAMAGAGTLEVQGRGIGRLDFQKIELVQNGEVVHATDSHPVAGHFEASMTFALNIRGPGWIALRIPLDAGQSELGRPLYAHTSPIYIDLAGKRIFRPQIAEELIAEIERNIEVIKQKAIFANDQERQSVLKVHDEGTATLRKRLQAHGR